MRATFPAVRRVPEKTENKHNGVELLNIGNVKIDAPCALAPMAGVADRAFRELCVSYGAGYVVGEMASSKGITLTDRKSKQLLYLSPQERPAAVQLFGNDPLIMAEAALKSLEYKPEIIDINMGCPAPKVAMNGGGSALMKDPPLAARITAAVVKAVTLPVTVKIRAGWDAASINAVEMAKRLEDAGASAITVHGRTREQMYAPSVDLSIIRQVKEAVSIPVIGNGDVTDPKSAARMLEETGCDLLMIGRGALGRPWVFQQINAYLLHERLLPEPSVAEKMSVMLRHVKKICEYKDDYIGMREARKHAAWYTKGLRGSAKLRKEIGALSTMGDLEDLAFKIVKENE